MANWKDLARFIVESLKEEGEVVIALHDPQGPDFFACMSTLEAGYGSLNERILRKYFWVNRKHLDACTGLMAKQEGKKWFVVVGNSTAENTNGY
jgi:hypothetical protein